MADLPSHHVLIWGGYFSLHSNPCLLWLKLYLVGVTLDDGGHWLFKVLVRQLDNSNLDNFAWNNGHMCASYSANSCSQQKISRQNSKCHCLI